MTTVLYELTFTVDKIGTGSGLRTMAGSGFQTSVSTCIKVPNLLLIGHVENTFAFSPIFNLIFIDCSLSNCVNVLKSGVSVMVVNHPAFLFVYL